MKRHVVGIDLGTCYSSIAWVDKAERVWVLMDEEGDALMPSAIHFAADNRVRVGKPALLAGKEAPEGLLEETKRLLGNPDERWTIGGVEYTPVDVAAFILRQLKDDFETKIGPISRAVVSVPATFNASQRALTVQAAQEAGLPICDLVNEPVAAALAFILKGESLAYMQLADPQTILVYDLGGGTFDLSIVEYDGNRFEVKETGGDPRLGGVDWTRYLAENVRNRFRVEHGWNLNRRAWRGLLELVEQAKRQISDPNREEATFVMEYQGRKERVRITRADFEILTQDLVDRTKKLTKEMMKRARLFPQQIQHLVAVGGSSRMPMIRKVLGELFFVNSHFKPNPHLSPDLAVAEGAAFYARAFAKRKVIPLEEPRTESITLVAVPQAMPPAESASMIVPLPEEATPESPKLKIINVCSHSLGVVVYREGRGRVNRILISRNTRLPATATLVVGNVDDGQRRIRVVVVEGEGEQFAEDMEVCTCVLDNLPPDLPPMSKFDLLLSYDEAGLLHVSAKHRETGLSAEVSVHHRASQNTKSLA